LQIWAEQSTESGEQVEGVLVKPVCKGLQVAGKKCANYFKTGLDILAKSKAPWIYILDKTV
jgi:hypothetical protein